jgi:Flp pilus assembly protein TadD
MLAMELVNASDLDGAVAEYTRILENDPDYVAAYYHRGQALEQLGREDDARSSYQDGITACDRIGDEHTKSELQDALEALG